MAGTRDASRLRWRSARSSTTTRCSLSDKDGKPEFTVDFLRRGCSGCQPMAPVRVKRGRAPLIHPVIVLDSKGQRCDTWHAQGGWTVASRFPCQWLCQIVRAIDGTEKNQANAAPIPAPLRPQEPDTGAASDPVGPNPLAPAGAGVAFTPVSAQGKKRMKLIGILVGVRGAGDCRRGGDQGCE